MKRARPILTEDQKGCILLRTVCGIDLDKIAEQFGISVIEVCRAAVEASESGIVDKAYAELQNRKLKIDWTNPTVEPYEDNDGGFVYIRGDWSGDERSELVDLGWEIEGDDATFDCDENRDADKALAELPRHIANKVTDYGYECFSNSLLVYGGRRNDKLRNVQAVSSRTR